MVKYKLEYFLARMVGYFAKKIPLKLAYFIGDRIGDLFFYVVRIRKQEAFHNLKQAFGQDKSDRAIKNILHQNYRHFGRVLMEFARIPLLRKDTILQQIPIPNLEQLSELHNQKKGVIVLSGHLGNWEYLAAVLARVVPSLYCLYKEQKNLAVDRIIKEFRTHTGLIPIKVKASAAKGILQALQAKSGVLVLIDQDAGRKGEFIDFFGRPASTSRGVASIAIRHRIPVIMALGIRESDGRITAQLEKFPNVDQFPNDDAGVTQFLIAYNRLLEKYICKHPEQYFWMHRRWKTQKKN